MPTRFNPALLAGLVAMLLNVPGCAPNRADWIAQAANQEAKSATSSIGNVQEVRIQARQGAAMLKNLSAMVLKDPHSNAQLAALFDRYCAQLSSGLDAIADSQTDEQFTAAVFGMCEPDRKDAASRVGLVMTSLATRIRANPPPNVQQEEVQHWVNYFDTFGERLINIPTECDHARAAMAEADAQERQAEIQHQANVNAAATATAVVLGTALLAAGTVAAAEANRPIVVQSPPVQNNYYINQPSPRAAPTIVPGLNIAPPSL